MFEQTTLKRLLDAVMLVVVSEMIVLSVNVDEMVVVVLVVLEVAAVVGIVVAVSATFGDVKVLEDVDMVNDVVEMADVVLIETCVLGMEVDMEDIFKRAINSIYACI